MEVISLNSDNQKIEKIKTQMRMHSQLIADPLCADKQMHYDKLLQYSSLLLDLNQIPYFCKQCKFQHRKGSIYNEHKMYAEIILPVQPVKIYTVDHNYTLQIQKNHSDVIDKLLMTLPPGTALSIESNDKLEVKYENTIIGEITLHDRKYNEIFNALNNNRMIMKCYLEYFQPREAQRVITESLIGNTVEERHVSITERKAEELWISIHIFEAQRYKEIFEGLIELLDYHTDLFPAFLALGPRVVKDLETYGAEKLQIIINKEKIADMVDRLHSHFKIDMGTQFSIML